MQKTKRFKNIKKKENLSSFHSFSYIERHYIYVLTQTKKETVIVDYIGLFKARADAVITSMVCRDGYRDCFNYLLKKNRRGIIWSTNKSIIPVLLSSRPGDPFEHHKHPTTFTKPIQKGETFDWIYHAQYTLYTPTKERIANIRKGHFWDSKEPMFRFYDTVHPVEHGYSFHFFAPIWLTPYNKSFVYAGDTNSMPLDDVTLAELGITIKRDYRMNTSPREFVKFIPSWKMKTGHWKHDYYLMTEDVSVKPGKNLKNIYMTFGFLMPEAKEWRKQGKKNPIEKKSLKKVHQ